jgi:hypothetical protein
MSGPLPLASPSNRYPGSLQAAFASHYNFAILLSQYGLPAALAIIGAIAGAPLVATEVEQRTHLAAWTQSVSRRRWYTTKISALAAGLAVAGLAAGTINAWLQPQLTTGDIASSRWSGLVEPPVVVSVDVFQSGDLDRLRGPPGIAWPDQFGLEQADHRLGERVVVGVADGPHRRAGSCSAPRAVSRRARQRSWSTEPLRRRSPGGG